MANCGQEVRRVPSRRAKVGKSFGSRRLPVVWWGDMTGDDEWTDVVRAAVDEDGEMAPPLLVEVGIVIDRVDDSLSEAVRPPAALLGDGGCDCDETALSDLDRSCRRWADERWTALGDLLPTSRLMIGTDILVVIDNGGGWGGGWGGGRIGLSPAPEEPAFSSFSLENRRGEMFKLATELDTYCCRALKKLIFVEFLSDFLLLLLPFLYFSIFSNSITNFSFISASSHRKTTRRVSLNWIWWKRAPHWYKDVNGLVDRIHLPLLFSTYKGGEMGTRRSGAERKSWERDAGFSMPRMCVAVKHRRRGIAVWRLYTSRRTRRDA